MPVWPGTAMTDPGHPPAARPEAAAEAEVERVTAVILTATAPPTAEVMESATAALRRFIGDWAPWVKVTARTSLPVDDPRRVAAEKAADEATYRARCTGPGHGLESAYTYCRSLALITRELRGHRQKLGLVHVREENAAGALALICRRDDVLMVSPSYDGRPGANFRLPGGPARRGEPAWEAMVRTVREETGLAVRPARLLAADWAPAGMSFVYAAVPLDGGGLKVTLPREPELTGYAWIPAGGLGEHCAPHQARRVRAALEAARSGTLAELRRGEPAYAVAA
ncbi:DUF6415 family natural product biosynthesis protein [Streptomyces caatingaensis]|uniref:Nudix hydrolase domain-containing protein n=1 Tax=Streptomyces caatingaensis TaxID=1678637 RepID=A0A0K9XD86_9ACTN|nr:DUF6415 family natural product biosynthesis protein [Streptomyces caatingaensis]KNB51081.1 hypothetical protein AC230_18230 [Streptomyces caatingaensis]